MHDVFELNERCQEHENVNMLMADLGDAFRMLGVAPAELRYTIA